jgi:hypothetical protein
MLRHCAVRDLRSTLTADLSPTALAAGRHLNNDSAGYCTTRAKSRLRRRGMLRASGTDFEAEAAVVWTLRDGKVVRFRQYVDTASLHPALAA